ncbi:DUF3427 domain-containing protein [Bacillus sp. 1P06AnD]|uniref:DUF3427 domain-containing protein n=1 Tax=Bacillus sp. 1P06AnD TaxID=3132208 RepID=UPI00399F91CA
MNFKDNLASSLRKGFIDQELKVAGTYRPKLLVNNCKKNENVLGSLLEELDRCDSFIFSVAFITESGLAMLKSHLWDLNRRGVKGRILTSTFLNFNQPKLFRELMKIKNIEVRLSDLSGFHSKGYIFHHKDHYSMIVGSSNLTANALKVNYEWNVKLTSHENGELIHHFNRQFEGVWEKSRLLTEEWIKEYEVNYKPVVNSQKLNTVIDFSESYQVNSIENAIKITPNKMQEAALAQIQSLRDAGKNKGLIISATGTGKTYLSAFDVRRFAPKRMLFIVHREQILKKAKSDYQKVLGGPDQDFGILSGNSQEKDAKYLFATIQTISRKDFLSTFNKDEFDYILIDEVHKAGASSYQKVINYFQPKFFLGMTATPERTDDINIYQLFDYNIAYEIRLQEALNEDMLCPFHYFGVTDIALEGKLLDDSVMFSKLVTDERVNHILEKIHFYGYSGEQVKGLMFCSRKEEASELSKEFNKRGLRTVALLGNDGQEYRAKQVKKLEDGDLDYILTVDIFNEGIDIPCINQVVMLRQTQSSIIFIQQLGRGLRKHASKDYVTIIDFIGNYKNNYLIPIALSGDQSLNKDNMRRQTKDTSYIQGISTVNFEEIAKKEIFKAINSSNLSTLKKFRESYLSLKNKIGRIPYLYDFLQQNSLDPIVFVNTKKYPNIHEFLLKMEKGLPELMKYENKVLSMFSLELLNGKRKHELILLDLLLKKERISYQEYTEKLLEQNCSVSDDIIASVERILNLSFFNSKDIKKYGEKPIVSINEEGYFYFNQEINECLHNHSYFKSLVKDLLLAANEKSKAYSYNHPLTLYQKYTRKDACRLLNWHNDESSTVYGYKAKYGTCPIFITYHKDDNVDASVKYGDEFQNPELLRYFTKNNRTLSSEEVKKIVYSQERGINLHIFVKKDDDEGSDFYYLGKAFPDKETAAETTMPDINGKELPVVTMNLLMEQPIEYNLYHYIVERD